MTFLGNIRKQLVSGGLSSEEFEGIRPDLREQNHQLLDTMLLLLASIFAIVAIIDIAVNEPLLNHIAHVFYAFVCLAVFFAERALCRRFPSISTIALYFLALLVYLYGIIVGVVSRPNDNAVTICVIVALVPMLVADRPWRVVSTSLLTASVFVVFTWYVKAPAIAIQDTMNCLSACAFGTFIAARSVATRLQNMAYNKKSELERQTDGLTGLLNKVAFEKRVASFLRQEESPEGTLLIVDADNFKRVNDLYGHDEGDRVLKEMALGIREAFRTSDYCGRFGGDEFVVFMQDSVNRRAARKCAERLLTSLPDNIKLPDPQDSFHVSIGIAFTDCIPDELMPSTDDSPDYKTLFKAADVALYRAKAAGRDGFCIAGYDSEIDPEFDD